MGRGHFSHHLRLILIVLGVLCVFGAPIVLLGQAREWARGGFWPTLRVLDAFSYFRISPPYLRFYGVQELWSVTLQAELSIVLIVLGTILIAAAFLVRPRHR